MIPRNRYAIFAVLTCAILLVLAYWLASPQLYSLEKDSFSSRFHENNNALKLQSLNSTSDVLPQIQDVLDLSESVSLNIRVHDFEQARKDLIQFQKSKNSLHNLVIRLDMNESEIQMIEQNVTLQKEALESLLNTSETLDSLQALEIQYNAENNQDMLTTVRLRGDTLREKVQGLKEQYHTSAENIVKDSTKIRANTTKIEGSQAHFNQITQEIENPASTNRLSVDTALPPGDERVSLFIKPDSGKYLDLIECMGISLSLDGTTTLRAKEEQITMYVDDQPVSSVFTDSFGYYTLKIPIEQISTGTHTVSAHSGTSRSMNRTLTVMPVNSITNLSVSKPEIGGNVTCNGSVMANKPVRNATIQIIWDQSNILVTKTDMKGQFSRILDLPPGQHTLVASFSDARYPILPSESVPQSVDTSLVNRIESVDLGPLVLIISVISLIILFLGAAGFYIRRMDHKKIPVTGPSENPASADTEDLAVTLPADLREAAREHGIPVTSDLTKHDDEPLIAYYTRLLKEQGLSTASWGVYQHMAAHIARDLHIKRVKSMTAREISRTCRGKPYCGPFTRFIRVYERIRYGGETAEEDQELFESALHAADNQMGGEDH